MYRKLWEPRSDYVS